MKSPLRADFRPYPAMARGGKCVFRCRNCNAGDHLSIYKGLPDRFYQVPGRFDYVRCARCGLLQIPEVPGNLADFYANYRLHSQESAAYRLFRAILIGHCYLRPKSNGGALLDVGCGNGWYLKAMQARGWRAFGYEFSEDYAQVLRARLGVAVFSRQEDLAGLRGSFDLVTFNFSFEHLDSPRQFLELAHQSLRKGGRVYLSVPNIESREARLFGERWFHLDPPRHLCLYSKSLLTRLLQETGFGDIRVRALPVPTGFAGSISYKLAGTFRPLIWYCAMLPGIVFALLARDGNIGVTGSKL